jgi:hypothetical protein
VGGGAGSGSQAGVQDADGGPPAPRIVRPHPQHPHVRGSQNSLDLHPTTFTPPTTSTHARTHAHTHGRTHARTHMHTPHAHAHITRAFTCTPHTHTPHNRNPVPPSRREESRSLAALAALQLLLSRGKVDGGLHPTWLREGRPQQLGAWGGGKSALPVRACRKPLKRCINPELVGSPSSCVHGGEGRLEWLRLLALFGEQ